MTSSALQVLKELRKRISAEKARAGKQGLDAPNKLVKAECQGRYDAYAFVVNYLDAEIRKEDKSE